MSSRNLNNTPSAIHLSGLLQPTSADTAKAIIDMRDRDLISLHQDLKKWIKAALSNADSKLLSRAASSLPCETVRQKRVKNAVIEILPLLAEFMTTHDVKWFKPIHKKRVFEFTRSATVPIAPIGYGLIDGSVKLVFSPTWKYRDLTPQQFRIWATLVHIGWLNTDPDLEGFTYINMSTSPSQDARVLSVRDESDAVDLLTPLELSWVRRTVDDAMIVVGKTERKKKTRKTKVNPQGELDI